MLIVKKDEKNNVIEMINISSLKGKEKRLIYDSNVAINNYYPLPVPSFAKLKTIYKLEYVKEIEQYISFNGKKLNNQELLFIKNERNNYMKKHKDANIIKFGKKEFVEKNIIYV